MNDEESINLKLTDYKQIWTKFCFLDESGSLGTNLPNDPFFTLGIIKCTQPYYLQSKIGYERNKRNFYDEMKFNKLSKNNIDFAKFAIDSFFDVSGLNFYSYTVDKEGQYFRKEFGGDPWKAYENITKRLLRSSFSNNEIIILIADHVTTPKSVRFETCVKREMNEEYGRLAVAGVCRFDSKSNDLLQVVDLMIGAINYDLKRSCKVLGGSGDKYKIEFLKHFKRNLGLTEDFTKGFRSRIFNIFVDKDVQQRLPLS